MADDFEALLKKHTGDPHTSTSSRNSEHKDKERSHERSDTRRRDKGSSYESNKGRDHGIKSRHRDSERDDKHRTSDRDKDRSRDRRYHDDRDRSKDTDRSRDIDRSRDTDRSRDRSRDNGRDRSHNDSKKTHKRSPDRDRSSDRLERSDSHTTKPTPDFDDIQIENSKTSAGEIACSVSETNRIRALLGLAPLDDEGSSDGPPPPTEEEINAQMQASKTQQIKEQLHKMKKDRQLNAKVSGPSLGEQLQEEDEGLLAWINKSREKQKLSEISKQFDELDAAAEEEATTVNDSLKVIHSIDELNEGDNILVLKDKGILDDDDDEELESIGLSEIYKSKQNVESKLKSKRKIYDVYGETNGEVLPQYSDSKNDEDKNRGFVIGSVNGKTGLSESIKATLEKERKILYDLSDVKFEADSEFYTKDEMGQLFKSRKKKKVKTKRKKRRDSTSKMLDDQKGNDDGESALEIEKILRRRQKTNKEIVTSSDHGSRRHSRKAEKEKTDRIARRERKENNYEKARQAAEQQANQLYRSKKGKEKINEEENVGSILAEDENESLNVVKLEKNLERKKISDLVRNRKLIKTEIKEEEEENTKGEIVFTETTEFCRALEPTPVRKRIIPLPNIQKSKPMEMDLPPENDEEDFQPILKKQKMGNKSMKSEKEEGEQDDDEDEDMSTSIFKRKESSKAKLETEYQEPLVSSGTAATLRLLEQKGGGKIFELEGLSGRANDKVIEFSESVSRSATSSSQSVFHDPAPKIQLDRRDEWGRKMTQKEAFRDLSHKFHGKKPGKKKQEKRLARYLEELKRKQMSQSDTPLKAMEVMKRTQEATRLPYVIIGGGGANTTANLPPLVTQNLGESKKRKREEK